MHTPLSAAAAPAATATYFFYGEIERTSRRLSIGSESIDTLPLLVP